MNTARTYTIGSDRQTRDLAVKMNRVINSALDRGDLAEAERLVDAALSTPNQPLRMEFLHVVETQDVRAS